MLVYAQGVVVPGALQKRILSEFYMGHLVQTSEQEAQKYLSTILRSADSFLLPTFMERHNVKLRIGYVRPERQAIRFVAAIMDATHEYAKLMSVGRT